jgi:hypothetical protein
MGVDVTDAANAAAQMMRNGLAANADEALDLLARGMQQGANSAGDLLDVVSEYGSTFAELGVSGPQAVGLIDQALAAGIPNADFAADALREMGIIGREAGEGAATALESLGLNAADYFAAMQAGGPQASAALDTVLDALRNTEDPAVRSAAAVELVGTQYEDLGDAILSMDPSEAARRLGTIEGAAAGVDEALAQGIGPTLASFGRTLETTASTGMSAFLAGLTDGKTNADGWQGTVQNLGATVGGVLQPPLEALGGFLTGTLGPALGAAFGWMADNQTTVTVMASLIGGVLAAAFLVWGTRALVAAGQNTLAWFTTVAAARTGAAGQQLSALQTVASWVLMGAQAVLHAGRVAAVWLFQTARTVAVLGLSWALGAAGTLASWALMGAQAVARAVAIGAVWLAQTAMTTGVVLAGWAVAVAAVVGGWVLMGVQSLAQAARMAAAWVLAMGPVGWVIAAVVGLVALIVANWDTVVGATRAAWNWAVGAVRGAVDFLVGLFMNFTIVGLIIRHWDTIKNTFSSGVDAAVSFVRELPGRIVSAVGNLGSLLVSAGGDLLRGLWNGISGSIGWLKNKVMDWAGSLLPGWVKDILGISSPSRVFAGLGYDTMRGFALGIEQGTQGTLDAVGEAARLVLERFRSGQQLFEDFTWYGNPDVVRQNNSAIQDAMHAAGVDAMRAPAADVEAALSRIIAQHTTPAYRAPVYDMPERAAAPEPAPSRTVNVSGVIGPEEVAALVRREQATDEFLAGVW